MAAAEPTVSLQSRIFGLFLALLLVVLGGTLYTVSRATYRHSLARAQDELAYGRRIFLDKLDSRQRALAESASTLAKDDALRQAIFAGPSDPESMLVALENHRLRTSADLSVLVTLDGGVLADTADRRREGRPFAFPELLREDAGAVPRVAVLDGTAYQLAAAPYYVPVSAPRPSLWLVLGRSLDDAFMAELRQLIGAEVVLVEPSAAAPLASSLAGAQRAAAPALAATGDPGRPASLAGIEVLALSVAIPGADTLSALLLRPTAEALLDYRQLSGRFAVVALAAALLALGGALVFARGVASPIRALGAAARRVAAGDYAAELPRSRAAEISSLARDFATMQHEVRAREEAIERLAFRDELTGLPNRTSFQRELERGLERARREHAQLAVAVIDLDRFRDINDTLGHHVGDGLLRGAGERLGAAAGERGMMAARLGGDEFGLLLPVRAVSEAQEAVDAARSTLEQPLAVDDLRIDVGASCGVAVYPHDGGDAATLMRRAEVAMYHAKERCLGFAFYDRGQDRHSVERLSLAGDLHRAVEAGGFELVFQPKLDLASGRVRQVEALLRWNHPRLGWLGPAEFIPIAEQHRVDPQDHRVGVAGGARAMRRVAATGACAHRGGQHLGARSARPRAAGAAARAARAHRRAGRAPGARDHREHGDGRARDRPAAARRGGGDGHHGVRRRLRHRLLLALPVATPAGAGAQGRQVLRHRDDAFAGPRADRALDHRARPQPRPAGGGGGRRVARDARSAARHGLRHGAGVSCQRSARRRHRGRLAAQPVLDRGTLGVSRAAGRRAALAVLLWAALGAPLAGAEHRLRGLFELRAVAGFDGISWLDRGFDRARYGEQDRALVWGSALLQYDGRLTPTLGGRVVLAGYDRTSHALDWTEAFLEYSPVPRSAWRFKVRGGAFYPPLSLENTAVGWTSPYTVSFSAIDTWIGEEVRALGLEVAATRMGRFTGSAHDWTLVGAAARGNDPLGALLAWRGFAVHDRQSGWREHLPLADLPGFRESGSFPPQEPFEEPFKELDGRTGYYAGVEWDAADRSRLRYLHYDNLADPSVVEGGQWSWRTRFDHLGWQLRLPAESDLLLQVLRGDTRMDGFTSPLVYDSFTAAYVLWSRAWNRHRWSARADFWSVRDEDTTPDDPNQEHGRAWTAAYFYSPPPMSRLGGWRVGVELRSLESDRPARRLLGEGSRRREDTGELTLQWRF